MGRVLRGGGDSSQDIFSLSMYFHSVFKMVSPFIIAKSIVLITEKLTFQKTVLTNALKNLNTILKHKNYSN